MANWEAVQLAIHMTQQPALIRLARNAPLPRGVTEVLELACRDSDRSTAATETFAIPEDQVHAAAIFFVEQVLFHHRASCYRILGTEADATPEELRRHMALLMKWLHPDAGMSGFQNIDRSVFVNRVTEAWEILKSPARRHEYDASIKAARVDQDSDPAPRPHVGRTGSSVARRLPIKTSRLQLEHRSVLRRVLSLWSDRH